MGRVASLGSVNVDRIVTATASLVSSHPPVTNTSTDGASHATDQ
jgi:hypothetical protein